MTAAVDAAVMSTRRRARRALGPLLLGGLALALGCGRFGKDADPRAGARIVSVSKQYTEILYALDAADHLVAVDVSSTYPEAARQLPTVGYHRALSAEGILAVRPTEILSGGPSNIGPEHVVRQLEGLKIPMTWWEVPEGIDGAKQLIRAMGAAFDRTARADSIVAALDADLARATDPARAPTDTPTVAIIHFGQAMNQYFLISSRSVGGQMVRWAGGRMAIEDSAAGMTRMTSPELLAKADPDVILMTDFGYDRLSGREEILALPGVAATAAARNGRIFRIEEHDLVYYGPRTGKNVELIRTLLQQPGTP